MFPSRPAFMALLVAAIVAVGCSSAGVGDDTTGSSADAEGGDDAAAVESVTVTTEAETTTTVEPVIDPGQVESILSTMTLEEKVGQLLMPVVSGSSATSVTPQQGQANETLFGFATPAEIVVEYDLGGVIYLGDNIETADQVGLFSAGLQQAAIDDQGIGLLVAVDQEGGRVNRITDGVTVFPPAAVLSGDSAAVREAGYLTGRQVSSQGINVVLAPVADVTAAGTSGSIGNRSYGDDPEVVAEMVSAAVDGIQGAGVAAAVKHWPGHGGTQVDSHLALPQIDISRADWDSRERVPFQAAIDEEVAIVLVGHLAIPALDPAGDPATVSPLIIDELLRGELGFDGVVMTDALNMQAVAGIAPGDVVVQAVAAGADILLVPPDLRVAYQALIDAVSAGTLPEARIDEAVLRVLRLKQRLGLLPAT